MQAHHAVIFCVALSALVDVGCKESKELQDKGAMEQSIRDQFKQKKLELKTVTCPQEIVRKEGTSFECDAVDDDGSPGKIKVLWKEGANFYMEPVTPVVGLKDAGDFASTTLSQQLGKKITVTCPAKAGFGKVGKTFSCAATVEGLDRPHVVDFTEENDKGGFGMKLHAEGGGAAADTASAAPPSASASAAESATPPP